MRINAEPRHTNRPISDSNPKLNSAAAAKNTENPDLLFGIMRNLFENPCY